MTVVGMAEDLLLERVGEPLEVYTKILSRVRGDLQIEWRVDQQTKTDGVLPPDVIHHERRQMGTPVDRAMLIGPDHGRLKG